MNLRRCTINDVAWMVNTALQKYPQFDCEAAYRWGCAHIDDSDIGMWRTADVWIIAGISERFYAPGQKYADVVFLCSGRSDGRSGPQIMALVRAARDWAVERGCVQFGLSAETGKDLCALAARLGHPKFQAYYSIDLRN